MEITLDCISCILRRAFQTCALIGMEESKKERAAREVLDLLSSISFDQTTGHIDTEVQKRIREISGVADPYNNAKSFYTDLALRAYPELKVTVRESEDPFATAARLALAGSAIDFVFDGEPDIVTLFNQIESVLSCSLFYDHIADLREEVGGASRILYLADNAGETVFDRIFIEELPADKVTYVVKGSPIMNDATMTDAVFSGLKDVVEVMDNGSGAAGTILDRCSAAFRERFADADVVIAKGQASFKTLSGASREIYHFFRVKCNVVAKALRCAKADLVIMNSHRDRNGKRIGGENSFEAAV